MAGLKNALKPYGKLPSGQQQVIAFIQTSVGRRKPGEKEQSAPSGIWGEHGCSVFQVQWGAVLTLIILLQGGTGAGLGGRAAGVEGVVGGSGGWAGAAGA